MILIYTIRIECVNCTSKDEVYFLVFSLVHRKIGLVVEFRFLKSKCQTEVEGFI